MKKVWFLGEECSLKLGKYANGQVAIQLICEDGSPMGVATAAVEGVELADGEVLIKDYSENSGMLSALIVAGIVKDTERRVKSGFVELAVCKLMK